MRDESSSISASSLTASPSALTLCCACMLLQVGEPADASATWWEASVEVPLEAACINFAVGREEHWDNNGGLNYKVAVDLPPGDDALEQWAEKLEAKFLAQLREARHAAEEAVAEKARRRAEQRKHAQVSAAW